MLIPNFETLLPRLVSTYEQGRLVPFVGSGMSRRACTDWPTFIASLEVSAGLHGLPALDGSTTREVLVRRANNAVRTLKRSVPGVFAKAVRAALLSNEPNTPLVSPQMRSLTGIWWPLALSTNYDNCYAAGFHGNKNFAGRQLAVVGRGAVDCQRVLTSLSTAGRSLLWALQGYLSDLPCADLPPLVSPSPEDRPQLEEQLVVGHEEYRRVTYRDLHFRRAFAEVFRQRSLLFLGAGLQESYLQELFGEVLEFYGPAARPHYAFVQEGEVDPAFMLARFQIAVVEYREHGEVKQWLDRLAEQVSQPRRTPVAWCWGRIDRSGKHWKSVPDLEVVRGPLPAKPKRSECLAVSAGGSGDRFYFSAGIQELMEAWGVPKPSEPSAVIPPYLIELGDRPVLGVRARAEDDRRNLSCIYDASLALFEHVAQRYRCIRMQLLSTGGQDKLDASVPQFELRNFPERFSFIQTLRAWATWRKGHPRHPCRLVLHVMLDSVYQDIASGRIDVLELLSCADVRFFVEVVQDDGQIERRLFQTMPDLALAVIVDDLQLSAEQWQVKVTPPPTLDDHWLELNQQILGLTMQMLGVVPGSTVHFKRPDDAHLAARSAVG
jgi:hypothetical protein